MDQKSIDTKRRYRGLRKTARMLGVSHTHLRKVLSGDRVAGPKLANAILLITGIDVRAIPNQTTRDNKTKGK